MKDFLPFLSAHPTTVSSNPECRSWTSEESQMQVSQLFSHDAAGIVLCKISISNNTRDFDRICPGCRRIYRVGERPQAHETFEAFLNRDNAAISTVGITTTKEQLISGTCSTLCFEAMNDGFKGMGREDISAWAQANMADL